MAKKTKRPRAAPQVTTNFKQNTKPRRRTGGGGGGGGAAGRPGRTQADFDPDQNVKQLADTPEAGLAPAPAAPTGDRFADAGLGAGASPDFAATGRSIPRMPDEGVA